MKSPGLLSFSSPHITVSEDVKRQKSPGLLFIQMRPTVRPAGRTGGEDGGRRSHRASYSDRSRRASYLPHKRRARRQEPPGLLASSSPIQLFLRT